MAHLFVFQAELFLDFFHRKLHRLQFGVMDSLYLTLLPLDTVPGLKALPQKVELRGHLGGQIAHQGAIFFSTLYLELHRV